MGQDLMSRVRERATAIACFFTQDVWNVRLEQLPPGKALAYRTARIAYCTLRGLIFDDGLQVRAAALTYFTVLSLVPLLAFAFAVLKGFGAYDALVEELIRPKIFGLLEGNAPLRQAAEKLLEFVGETGVASLGFIGLLFLVYAATRLLRNVEGALNEIWAARSARGWFQQLRDYIAIIIVLPLSLMAAAALTTLGQAIEILQSAGELLGISGLVDQAISVFTPLTVLFLALLFLYIVLPNAPIKIQSAAVGAAIGSVAWYLVLIAHVQFQVGVARFNALYSSFAAIPIFLAWQHVSWVVVLVGAQVAALHQHHRSVAQRARMAKNDQALTEALCLSAVLRVVRAFAHGQPYPTRDELSQALDAPEELLGELLDRLVKAGMLVVTSAPRSLAYGLAKPPETIRIKDVLDALRRSPEFQPEAGRIAGVDARAAEIWLALDEVLTRAPVNRTLRELVDEGRSPASEPRSDGHGREREQAASSR